MSVIYVREQGTVVRKRGETLRVMKGQDELFTIPLANLEQLNLIGNVQLTTQAAGTLLNRRVDVVFLSLRLRFKGKLSNNESRAAELRHAQLRLVDDESRSFMVSLRIVQGKIANQRVVLQRRAEEDVEARRALDGMMQMKHQAEHAPDLDSLRGYEGKAAAYYFAGVRTFFPPSWGFQKRDYYPPPDPANAMLSLAYTLLLKDVEAQLQIVGLDPYLGFFHTLGYNRPGLALDLMEEFRPSVADVVVLTLVMGGQITLDDFEWTNDERRPVRMGERALQALLAAYEERMAEQIYHPLANGQTSYRRAIELQARRIARVIHGDEDYSAVEMR